MSMATHVLKTEESGNVRILTFTGGQEPNIENMLALELESLQGKLGDLHLLLDFTHVERISSVELGTLISLHKRMKATGGRLTLFNLNPHVFGVFEITRLNRLMDICR